MSRRSAVITLVATLVISWGSLLWTQSAEVTPLLGLDLQGGFSVVLEAPDDVSEDVLDKAVEIMRRRIEALGNVQEPEIAVLGTNQIEVQLPGVTDRERALAAVGRTGQLEFRPVLDISPIAGLSPVFAESAIFDQPIEDADTPIIDFSGDEPEVVDETTTTEGDTTTTTAATGETTDTTAAGDETTTTTEPVDIREGVTLPEGLTWCDETDGPGCVDPVTGLSQDPTPDQIAFLAADTGIVYHLAPAAVLGADLAGAQSQFQGTGGSSQFGSVGGEWVVRLDFNDTGAEQFADTTRELAGYPIGDVRRQFAIVLDGTIQSAPQVATSVDPAVGITGGTAVITIGTSADPGFDQQAEADELSVILRYGSLPVAFEQVSVQSVSATLGSDSLQAGLVAGIGGLLLVALAMIAYYRALGLVNVIGLTVFGSLLVVVYSLLGEWQGVTLTLAGVAGVIVAIGITSDSYIVYFERIKEEVHKGRSLRAAIDHAFQRSFRTILTADTVSFFGAVLLFFLAVGSVKGFALALLIATILDVVVAVAYTRPAVALVARSRFGDGGSLSIRGATGLPREDEE
jgi:preprotein translocase subunit SecD